jgi:hypothetical protein
MVNNSTNINKTKDSLNSDDQQFHQYQREIDHVTKCQIFDIFSSVGISHFSLSFTYRC